MHPKDEPILHICLIYIFVCSTCTFWASSHFLKWTNENNMLQINLFALENWAWLIWILVFLYTIFNSEQTKWNQGTQSCTWFSFENSCWEDLPRWCLKMTFLDWHLNFGFHKNQKPCKFFLKITNCMYPKDAQTNPPHLPNTSFIKYLYFLSNFIFSETKQAKNLTQIWLFALKNWPLLIWTISIFTLHLQATTAQTGPKSLKLYFCFIPKSLVHMISVHNASRWFVQLDSVQLEMPNSTLPKKALCRAHGDLTNQNASDLNTDLNTVAQTQWPETQWPKHSDQNTVTKTQ